MWAVAHQLVRLIWKILRRGVRDVEYGEAGDPKARRRRAQKMARRLRALGWTVIAPSEPPQPQHA